MTDNARGIGYMVLGAALLSSNDALSKALAADLAVTQVWCLRAISATAIVAVVALTAGPPRALRVQRPLLLLMRALLFVATTLCIVAGLSVMPLINLSAIVFATPLVIAMLSPLLLGEAMRRHRALGALIGFVGVLAIIKPGSDVFQLASLVAVLAALLSALRDILTRVIARFESALAILFWSNAAVLVVGAIVALTPWVHWQPVSVRDGCLLIINGALNVAAHFCIVRALGLGEVSVVSPYRYAGVLWAVGLGAIVFGELPDAMTFAGAAAIVASGLYVLARERRTD